MFLSKRCHNIILQLNILQPVATVNTKRFLLQKVEIAPYSRRVSEITEHVTIILCHCKHQMSDKVLFLIKSYLIRIAPSVVCFCVHPHIESSTIHLVPIVFAMISIPCLEIG